MMSNTPSINILIAEDNDVSREMMAAVLRTRGYTVFGAIDGESAIKVVKDRDIDLALVDINMAPTGGFAFVKHLVANTLDIPVVIITADESSDILTEASALGVTRVMQKPVEPDRLLKLAEQIFKRRGLRLPSLGAAEAHSLTYEPAALLQKALALAEQNARMRQGAPFGALVADHKGHILGEGVSSAGAQADPTAHAEVMAIRKAAEKLGKTNLSDCILYCSAEPTMVGKALIKSVGIPKIYFGLSHADISGLEKHTAQAEPEYIQSDRDAALDMLKRIGILS
ncbi:MAG: response regulator [Alphaproteobacteria bacterium]|nr:response regulator [Alphaproteobacteria bacterium]